MDLLLSSSGNGGQQYRDGAASEIQMQSNGANYGVQRADAGQNFYGNYPAPIDIFITQGPPPAHIAKPYTPTVENIDMPGALVWDNASNLVQPQVNPYPEQGILPITGRTNAFKFLYAPNHPADDDPEDLALDSDDLRPAPRVQPRKSGRKKVSFREPSSLDPEALALSDNDFPPVPKKKRGRPLGSKNKKREPTTARKYSGNPDDLALSDVELPEDIDRKPAATSQPPVLSAPVVLAPAAPKPASRDPVKTDASPSSNSSTVSKLSYVEISSDSKFSSADDSDDAMDVDTAPASKKRAVRASKGAPVKKGRAASTKKPAKGWVYLSDSSDSASSDDDSDDDMDVEPSPAPASKKRAAASAPKGAPLAKKAKSNAGKPKPKPVKGYVYVTESSSDDSDSESDSDDEQPAAKNKRKTARGTHSTVTAAKKSGRFLRGRKR